MIIRKLLIVLLGVLVGNSVAYAQNSATTLDQLLNQVRAARTQAAEVNRRREREFTQDRNQQQARLNAARQALARENARSTRLSRSFEANERQLTELNERLRIRMGNLGEVFGVVRQMAGNAKAIIDNSLTSAQIPNRGEELSKLAQSKALPGIAELENLWYTLQQEMTESGRVVKFSGTIIADDGTPQQTNIVRVGVFNAIGEDGYLRYVTETGSLVVLQRQPREAGMAEDLYEATSGVIRTAIDPTSGQLLGALVQSPTWGERIDQGGPIGYATLTLGAFGLLIGLMRLVVLFTTGRKMKSQLASGQPSSDNALGRVLGVYAESKGDDIETLELKLDEAILKETPELESWQGWLKIIAAVAPLMGLLGTVTGMIRTFQSITLFGTSDPKLMAGGISMALVTTVEGLVVAIPLVLLHSIVAGRSKNLVQILEEQAAGIMAAQAERHV